MPEQSTLVIPKDVLEPIIQAHVAKAITEALGGQGRIIEEAVRVALEAKVDERDGKVSSYASTNAPTFLTWLVRHAIRDAATAAVREHLTADMERIKAAVAKEMKNQRSPLTRSLIEGIAKATTDSARFQISVNVNETKAY